MANELFQFTIIDYTTNPLGDSTIVEEPIGWDGVEFELVRMETHGFVSSLNIENIDFQFRGAAKVILDDAYDGWGNEAQVELKIEWRGNPSDTYTQIYLGLFKFLTYRNICGVDCYTTIGISMAGCYPLFHNRKNQSVDLGAATSFDGTALSPYTWINNTINIPPKNLKLINQLHSDKVGESDWIPNVTGVFGQDEIMFMLEFTNKDSVDMDDQWDLDFFVGIDNDLTLYTPPATNIFQAFYESGFPPAFEPNQRVGITCNNLYTLEVDLDIDFSFSAQGGASDFLANDFYFVIGTFNPNFGITNPSIPTLYFSPNYGPINFIGTSGTINITEVLSISNFQLNTGDKLFVNFYIKDISSTAFHSYGDLKVHYTINNWNYNLINYSDCVRTACKTSMINETLSRMVEAYTNDCMRVKSDYFGRTDSEPYTSSSDGCGSLEVFASGLNMRGARNAAYVQPPFLLDWDTAFNGLKPIHNIGYGLETDTVRGAPYEWIRVENYEHFYDTSVVLTLPYPNLITREVDTKEMVSQIKIGYNNWGNEQQQGRNDVFASREIASNLSRVSNSLNLNSNLVASDFAIEFTRRIYGLSSVDSPFDDKVFIICMVRDGGDIIVELFPSATATNVYSVDTMKNIRITPMRNLLRNIPTLSKYIKTSLAYEFYFKNGEANFIAAIDTATIEDCILEVQGVELREDNPITDLATFETASFGTPILANELVSFEYPLTCAEWLTLKANPYGLIEYSCANGTSEFGWIKQFNYNAYQGMASFKLIKQL